MKEQPPTNIIEALKYDRNNKNALNDTEILEDSQHFSVTIDPLILKYFFDLQSSIEKDGDMDYHLYARKMWEKLIGDITPENEQIFHQFENTMILKLNNIDMKSLVYKDITENIVPLITQYEKSVKNIAIWSTDDVKATGYQVSKINNSKILQDFHRALKTNFPKGEIEQIMKEKTSYLVADNKFESILNYVVNTLEKTPNEKIKIVIVEDSRKNFDEVKKTLSEKLGDKISQIEIVPIWATYSREGKQAEDKAKISTEEGIKFEEQKVNLNAISSFKNLLNTERFAGILKDAHIFIDFDGVIGDNVAMREEQARIIYSSLMKAAIVSTGLTEEEIVSKIKSAIENWQ